MATQYVAPRRGCAYEEEGVRWELFAASRILDWRSPRLAHLLGEHYDILEEDEDDVPGPLIIEIPRKYLIEALPARYPPPTAAQLAIPAVTPTRDDRLRQQYCRT